jgi:hypothetical protein
MRFARFHVRSCALIAAIAISLGSCAGFLPVSKEPVRCVVDARNPASGVLRVTMELPASLAGAAHYISYRITDKATFISYNAVIDGKETAIALPAFGARGSFTIPAFTGSATIVYEIKPLFFPPGSDPKDENKADCRLTSVAGILRTYNVLGSPSFRAPLSIRFLLPEGWRAVAPWPRDGSGFLAGPEWGDAGIQEYIGLGPFEVEELRIGEVTLSLGFYPGVEQADPEIIGAMLGSLFGRFGPPTDATMYSAFTIPESFLGGGASCTHSIVASDSTSVMLHEFIHWWNDSRRIADDAAWFREGFTVYAGLAHAREAGAISPERALEAFADLNGEMRILEKDGGISLIAASPRMNENQRMRRLVYSKGALFALWAEGLLSASDRSIDELIAAVLGGTRSGLTTADLRGIARSVYGSALEAGFDAFVQGTEALPDLGLPEPTWKSGAAYFRPGD